MKFSKKKFFGLSAFALSVIAAGAVAGSANGGLISRLVAENNTKGKHYAAVMPTADSQGIREYWTDCVGGAPVFVEPEFETEDATLTSAQVSAILANPKDERIIPTLDRIQAAVTKNVSGYQAYEYTYVYDAYGYTYLDGTTKAMIHDANEESIIEARMVWDQRFTCAFDAAKDTLIQPNTGVLARATDDFCGDVLTLSSTLTEGEAWSWSTAINKEVGNHDYVIFCVYVDQPTDLMYVNGPWTKSLDLCTDTISSEVKTTKGLTKQAWNVLKISAANWAEMGISQLGIYCTASQAYGVVTGGQPALISSLFFYDVPSEEGQTIIRGKDCVVDAKTWGAATSDTVVTTNVKTEYGRAVQVDVKSQTAPIELAWSGLNVEELTNYDYARMYVYAKSTERVFVSLNYYRNEVVSMFGVDPYATDNKTLANSQQGNANVVADQWNYIDIPTKYLAQDNNGTFYITIWSNKKEAKDGWLFTDFVGHNQKAVVDNGGMLIPHNTSASTSVVYDGDMGVCSRVTLAAAQGFAKQNKITNISEFEELSFMVKNEATSNMKLLIYIIASGAYGKQGTQKDYFEKQVLPGQTEVIKVDIADYFGTYAATSSITFRVDGAAGNSMLFSCFEAK